MTPDKRLDQSEPVLADIAQKTDRLIESNGQILDMAIRANTNAEISARGVADLMIKVNQLAEGQVELRNRTDLLIIEQTELRSKTDLLAKGQADLHRKTDLMAGDQAELRREMQKGFQDVNQKFTQVEQTQRQILTLLLDRLK